jgi:hypothetical protein
MAYPVVARLDIPFQNPSGTMSSAQDEVALLQGICLYFAQLNHRSARNKRELR